MHIGHVDGRQQDEPKLHNRQQVPINSQLSPQAIKAKINHLPG